MANFKTWVEETRAGNYLVRHRDGKTKLMTGRWKVFTDYCIDKNETIEMDGEKFTGKRLANELAEKVKERYYGGELEIIDSSIPFPDLVEQFLDSKANLAWRTRIVYSQGVYGMLKVIPTLHELTKNNLMAWRKTMEKAGYANNTIWSRMNVGKMFCHWLIEERKIAVSPFKKGMIPAKTEAKARFYTVKEFLDHEEVAEKVDGIIIKIAFRLAHDHGLRMVEIVGDGRERLEGVLYDDLMWNDDGTVDLVIRKEVTKGQKKSRKIRLDPELVDILGSRKSGPLVPMKRSHLQYIFDKTRKMAPIKKNLTFHGQRHSFGKNYMQSGGNQAALRDLFGHTDIKTTEIYTQFEESYLDSTMERTHQKVREKKALAKVAGQKTDIFPEIMIEQENEKQKGTVNI